MAACPPRQDGRPLPPPPLGLDIERAMCPRSVGPMTAQRRGLCSASRAGMTLCPAAVLLTAAKATPAAQGYPQDSGRSARAETGAAHQIARTAARPCPREPANAETSSREPTPRWTATGRALAARTQALCPAGRRHSTRPRKYPDLCKPSATLMGRRQLQIPRNLQTLRRYGTFPRRPCRRLHE